MTTYKQPQRHSEIRMVPIRYIPFILVSILFPWEKICSSQEAGPVILKGLKDPAAEDEKLVNEAINRGIAFLRKKQLGNGSFGDGLAWGGAWPVGFAALPALTFLESGVPTDDPAVQKTAKYVREKFPGIKKTYEISLAILFLNRLGEAEDIPRIRTLALRLAAGQSSSGDWGYDCPLISKDEQEKIFKRLQNATLAQKESKKLPEKTPQEKKVKVPIRPPTDNSNTQFAILALCSAQKHIPVQSILAPSKIFFARINFPTANGAYRLENRNDPSDRPYGSMTCVGLLALAAGRGSEPEDTDKQKQDKSEKAKDEGIVLGLRALGSYLDDPRDSQMPPWPRLQVPNTKVNLYFLWSVERVGVFCDLRTIGGKDWYRWGVDHIIPAQLKDGSWIGTGAGGFPVIDTCFALLFLKRSDLLPDLRETLQKRLTITDPGLDGKGTSDSKKSLGDKKSPK